MTLKTYNSKYSNSSFIEKKTMQNGFDDSGIRMNTWIARKDKWTLIELEERSQYLREHALTIWAASVTEYKPEEKQLDTYTLEDELTGHLIARFTFKNTEQNENAFSKSLEIGDGIFIWTNISTQSIRKL